MYFFYMYVRVCSVVFSVLYMYALAAAASTSSLIFCWCVYACIFAYDKYGVFAGARLCSVAFQGSENWC